MTIEWKYLPILKWKQAEQLTLRNLTDRQWSGIVPLIELQPMPQPSSGQTLKQALAEHLSLKSKINENILNCDTPIFIDTSYLITSFQPQAKLLVAVCDFLRRTTAHQILPVINSSTIETLNTLTTEQIIFLNQQAGILLRLRTDQISASQVGTLVDTIATSGIEKRKIHILLDQYSLVGRHPHDCITSITPYIDTAFSCACASVTLGGGSFPINLMGINKGHTTLPRIEWQAWNLLKQAANYPKLRYADYSVTNPEPIFTEGDGKKFNPSIAIRYTADDSWHIFKGASFKGGIPGEYKNLCKLLISEPIYSGSKFSYGDAQYQNAANGPDTNGTPMTWRKEATSHHIVLTSNLI